MNPLKDICYEKRITQQEIADVLGSSQQTICRKLRDQYFTLDELSKIFAHFHFTDNEILMVMRRKTKATESKEIKKMIIDIRRAVVGG